MRIGLIPLDERPVNTRYPAMIATIAGVDVVLPPAELLSQARTPANCEAIAQWLRQEAPTLDFLIVSVETLGYGGLIASRTTDEAPATIAQRLEVLREIKRDNPALAIFGFNVVTRISRSNYNFEEALYWENYGNKLWAYSQLFDQYQKGQDVGKELLDLRAQIPDEYVQDFQTRRLRNHIVNLDVLHLFTHDVFNLLVISSDDTSEYGFGTQEKWWLNQWVGRIAPDDNRLLLYPGADEVGAALLARAIVTGQDEAPKFAIRYAIPEDSEVTAPFEDGPVSITVERQIRAVGGQIVEAIEEAAFVVAVNPPSRINQPMYPADAAEAERKHRNPYLDSFVQQMKSWIDAGKAVIAADVAYPNGSDPVFIDLMRQYLNITQLAAYGGWNTAGNTIGVALAQGIAYSKMTTDEQRTAQARFLLHRFVEDWAYQHLVRQEVRALLGIHYGVEDVAVDNAGWVRQRIEEKLSAYLMQLPGFAEAWQIVPSSIRQPWGRFFEVDFDLERI